jgi:hypothetical protein
MWYRMPIGPDASCAAGDVELHRCLSVFRCAGRWLQETPEVSGQEGLGQELGRIILAHVDRAERAARRR